jgi:RNA polymerase sigma-70 factor (ECF subfamily)
MMASMASLLRAGTGHALAATTDARLVARARSGDRHAFDELAIRYYRASYRTARAIVQSHTDAEDAVQDALVHAYVKLDSFRGDAAFGTWIIAITRNQAISRLRSQRRHDRTTVTATETIARSFASRQQSPEDIALHSERRRRLAQCVETLPATLRDALRLAWKGQRYKEIAAQLGAPTGTIKSRVWLARRIVARQLWSQNARPQPSMMERR